MRRELDEPVQSVFISSARYAGEWYHHMYMKTFVGYFKDRLNKNRVFNSDIFLGIKYGLKSKEWLKAQESNFDPINYKMELLNEPCGEADDAYFSLEMFQKNQTIKSAFIPPTANQIMNGTAIPFRKKEPEEIRCIFVDFAFVDSVAGKADNDNTVIGCGAILRRGNGWVRRVEHLETCGGGKKDHALLRIRELMFDYESDYCIYD